MKILFLTNFYPPYEKGGYEQLCSEVVNGLAKKGHQTAVVTSDYGVSVRSLPYEVGVYRVLKTEIDWRPYRGTLGFFMGRDERLKVTLACFRDIVNEFQPDVLFVWGMWNLPRELLLEAQTYPALKIVYYFADYWPTLPDAYTLHWQEPARNKYTSVFKGLMKKVAFDANQHNAVDVNQIHFETGFCVSDAVRQRLLASNVPITHSKVVYNGIELKPFLEARKKWTVYAAGSTFKLLYAGRLAPEKGVHTLIEAAARLMQQGLDVSVTIVGGGADNYVVELKDMIQRLNLADAVTFQGFVPRETMPDIMANFDALVFASTWEEPLARIVQEAMAVGPVVIGTTVGGMPEILENGINGLTFSPENHEELADQIKQLILSDGLSAQLSAAGYETVVKKFNIQRMFDEIEIGLQNVVYAVEARG
ncbi:MAG: glycosyltransferase family 4 protein [Anaerolineae bacterium]|nr:glycosyltransferase family 4 protein [Anaerolineae bacterium]